ncbi:MAG: hypothetical protein ABI907_03470 [Ramlibacter sp.]
MPTPTVNKGVFTAYPANTCLPDPEDVAANRRHFLKSIEQSANNWLQDPIMKTAAAVKVELDRVANLIAEKSGPGCKMIDADPKSEESARRKIDGECDGHWLDLKDAARCTLAARSLGDLSTVVGVLRATLIHRDGYTLAKDEETHATGKNADPCGYSGFNFVVRFGMKPVSAELPSTLQSHQQVAFKSNKFTGDAARAAAAFRNKANSPFMHQVRMSDAQVLAKLKEKNEALVIPDYVGRMAEIQVNTYAMMYGKMGKQQFESMFGSQKWNELYHQTGIEGGFGHVFYEDWREDKVSDAAKAIAALSTRYYARMRGTDVKPSSGGDLLNEQVMAYIKARPPKKAHS